MPPERSDVSGQVLDGDEPQQVVCTFADGQRRRVLMSTVEATALHDVGQEVARNPWGLLGQLARENAKWLVPTVFGAIFAALIGSWISDSYSDRQTEIQLEAELVSSISHDSVELFQKAQDAARSSTAAERNALGNRAADGWVLSSAGIQGTLEAYYSDSHVLDRWSAFQSALYRWSALAIDATAAETPAEAQARRARDVEFIHEYVDSEIGPSTRTPPLPDPWTELKARPPVDSATYQWLGFYVLRGRGELLEDLRNAEPELD